MHDLHLYLSSKCALHREMMPVLKDRTRILPVRPLVWRIKPEDIYWHFPQTLLIKNKRVDMNFMQIGHWFIEHWELFQVHYLYSYWWPRIHWKAEQQKQWIFTKFSILKNIYLQ